MSRHRTKGKSDEFPVLRELRLERFGKFRNASFDIADVTVFYGKNEAGKTTLFDSLFYALCAPTANRKPWKELRHRYGEEIRISLLSDGGEIPPGILSEDEFLNVYSVRSGDIHIQLDPGQSWVERVRTRLFTGGIDPTPIIENLEKKVSDRANLTHNRERARAEDEAKRLSDELEGFLAAKRDLLRREETLHGLNAKYDALKAKIDGNLKRIASLERDIGKEEPIRQRQIHTETLKRIDQIVRLEKQLETFKTIAADETAELNRREEELRKRRAARSSWQERLTSQEEDLARLQRELSEQDEHTVRLRKRAHRAALYLDRIKESEKSPPWKRSISWNRPLLTLAPVLALAGFTLALFAESGSSGLFGTGIFAAVAGLALAGAAVLAARRVRMVPDEEAIRHTVRSLVEQWMAESESQESRARFETLEGFRAHLHGIRMELDAVEQSREEKQRRLTELTRRVTEAKSALELEEREAQQAEISLKEWFEKRGIADRDGYVSRREQYRQLSGTLASLRKEFQNAFPGQDLSDLESVSKRRLEALDRDGVPERGRSETELQGLRREREQALASGSSMEEEIREILKQKENLSGEIRATMEGLSEEIRDRQTRIHRLREEIDRRIREKRAAAITLSLFQEMGQDTTLQLESLTREIASTAGRIFPELREAEMETLDLKQVRLTDEGGDIRPLEHLSGGTRDSFLLAARLSIAKRLRPDGGGLLVLDEPFLSMDEGRVRKSLELLRDYSGQKWQLILFTKERELPGLVESIFPRVRIHRMNGNGGG